MYTIVFSEDAKKDLKSLKSEKPETREIGLAHYRPPARQIVADPGSRCGVRHDWVHRRAFLRPTDLRLQVTRSSSGRQPSSSI